MLHRLFSAERVSVVRIEDMFAMPAVIVREVCAFLGLATVEPIEVREHNAGVRGTLDRRVREELRGFFAPNNWQSNEFVGRDMEWR